MFSKVMMHLSLLLISPTLASAEYQLISEKQIQRYDSYAQIDKQESSQWVSLNRVGDADSLSTEFLIQDMRCSDEDTPKRIKASGFYLSMSSISIAHKQPIVVPVTDYLGHWYLAQLDEKATKVKRNLQMKEVGVIRAGATSPQGYFMGGSDTNNRPLLMLYSSDLKRRKILSEKNSTEGEISGIFNRGNEVAAIYNKRSSEYSSAKFLSELRLYSPVGMEVAKVRLDGLDGSGVALEDGSIIVSYWDSGKIYMERFNPDLSPKWKLMLHQIEGIASINGAVLIVGESLAWIGANDNKLLVHRIEKDGSAVSTRIDSNHKLNPPQPLKYSASAYGDEIHIRGRTNRGKGATLGAVTEFCLVEKP
ncbi:MAG: hypothetical protein JNM01_09820 [Delftia acidovorans]|nr:hypothetical protein [Delftia acidovorans]